MTSIRSLALFNGGSCVVAGLVGTDTVTTQDPHGLYDTTNEEWGLFLATTGDRYLATSGYFSMATDM